ncbi:hypothetical protein M406DRAFT_45099 [Cryphonectria parasitica EP155]|uniref:HD domain-containing protein n=1 Tax=Cryphonectria parasitica (strain ATCC 38755 / EP155) TaxID=660469 RepID=A0A9P5CRK6_CRYP1|nr:uncharacterized protein M406DRAFT_45099 [Cryphonectria parasitica EP155]KAF3768348.1 hypothetical protein M406DRAFT_45099 [Cryphonectria parasitica EP155]
MLRGIENPESVAAHMYQMALMYLQLLESNRAHTIEMAIIYNALEAFAGDIIPSDGVS